MKKFYIISLMAALLSGFSTWCPAMVHMVQVQNYMFTPASFVASTGDTIHWMWVNGTHTTTSTTIPPGAATWDQTITASNPDFVYVATVPGEYDYECSLHVGMGMIASFTVVNATSVAELTIPPLNLGKTFLQDGYLLVEFTAPSVPVSFQLFDITGHRIYDEWLNPVTPGVHRHSIPVATIPAGIYILNLMTNDDQRTKRIVIDH